MNYKVIKRYVTDHCRQATWTFVALASIATTACVDDSASEGRGTNGVSDAVRFNVTDGQLVASAKRAAGLTRSIMPEPVAASVFETKVLPTDNPDYSVVQTTVEGVNPITPTPGTRAVVAWTRGRFSSTGMNGTSQTAMTNQWFDSEPTQGDGTLDNLHRWTWQKPWGRFFAVYPEVTSSYSKIALSPAGHLPTPYVDFEVEANVQNMKDLMIARSNDAQYVSQGDAPATSLQFQHALTAVKFSVGDNLSLGTITKIEITGALSKGRYTMSDAPITQGTWTYPSTDRSQVNSLDGVSIAVSQTPNAAIAGTDGRNYTFYMLPQQLDGQNVKAMIYYTTPDNKNHKLTIRLKGQWEAGTTSEYKLSQSNSNWQYHFTVTNDNLEFAYNEATPKAFQVTSWRENGAVKQPVAWKVTKMEVMNPDTELWEDLNMARPAWLTNLITEGLGDANGAAQVCNTTVQPEALIDKKAIYNQELKAAPEVGSPTRYWNLANPIDGGDLNIETANCYVISAPGYYRIPLAYGNGVKASTGIEGINGTSVNKFSYLYNGVRPFPAVPAKLAVMEHLVDHEDKLITSPYINEQMAPSATYPARATTPVTQAHYSWSDILPSPIEGNASEPNGAFTIQGSGKNMFIAFHVTRENIQSGNLTFNVCNVGNTTMWSYHLWFAQKKDVQPVTIKLHSGAYYKIMRRALGNRYVDWRETSYLDDRKVRLTLKPNIGNANQPSVAYVTITHKAEIIRDFSPMLYQFGRKDPFPGHGQYVTWNTTHTYGGRTVGYGALFPWEMFPMVNTAAGTGNEWGWTKDTSYLNLWSMNNCEASFNGNEVIKTIYDPCPAGFEMPVSLAFTGFTTTGENSNTPSEYNVRRYRGWHNGWFFKTADAQTPLLYIGTTGAIAHFSGTFMPATFGTYWTAIPLSGNTGCDFVINENFIMPKGNDHAAMAYAIWPAYERPNKHGATNDRMQSGGVIRW